MFGAVRAPGVGSGDRHVLRQSEELESDQLEGALSGYWGRTEGNGTWAIDFGGCRRENSNIVPGSTRASSQGSRRPRGTERRSLSIVIQPVCPLAVDEIIPVIKQICSHQNSAF